MRELETAAAVWGVHPEGAAGSTSSTSSSEPTGIGTQPVPSWMSRAGRIRWRRSNSFDSASEPGTTPIETECSYADWVKRFFAYALSHRRMGQVIPNRFRLDARIRHVLPLGHFGGGLRVSECCELRVPRHSADRPATQHDERGSLAGRDQEASLGVEPAM